MQNCVQNNESINAVYSALRNEIIHNHDAANNFFIVAVTATAVLIGVGLKDKENWRKNKENWSIFLSPFAIIIPAGLLIAAKMFSTFRIASFLKVVVEPLMNPAEVRWETRLNATRVVCTCIFDKCICPDFMCPDLLFYLAISLGLGGLGLFCTFLAYTGPDNSRSKKQKLVCIITSVISLSFFFMFIVYPFWRYGGYSGWIGEYEKLWKINLWC